MNSIATNGVPVHELEYLKRQKELGLPNILDSILTSEIQISREIKTDSTFSCIGLDADEVVLHCYEDGFTYRVPLEVVIKGRQKFIKKLAEVTGGKMKDENTCVYKSVCMDKSCPCPCADHKVRNPEIEKAFAEEMLEYFIDRE